MTTIPLSLRASPVQLMLVVALVAGSFGAGYAVADQPHMQRALGFLQSANAELQEALADKAGHRVEAIKLVEAAIVQVREGIGAGR